MTTKRKQLFQVKAKSNKENKKTLYDYLGEIKDFRRGQGQRHDLRLVLLIVIMAVMSGYKGVRAIGDFIDKHRTELIEELKVKKDRLPTFPTVGRILQNIEFKDFEKSFSCWAMGHLGKDDDKKVFSLDGKVICGTVSNPNNNLQKYINLVSIFETKRKQVIGVGEVGIEKKSEIPVVRQLIKDLDLEGVIFTIDALHCQKDTVKTIIEGKNDYIIGVKDNQKSLNNTLKKIV